jgi:hypothetical protein
MRTAAGLATAACGFAAAVCLGLAPVPAAGGMAACVGLVAGSLAAGALFDRGWGKAALVAGLAWLSAGLWSLAAGGAAQASIPLSMGALGLGAGMALLAANALVWAEAPVNRAGALNLLNLLLPLGVLILGLGTPATRGAAAVVATAALAVAMWTPAARRAPEPPEPAAAGKRPAISLLALLLFLYAACEAGTWGWLVEYWRAARVLDRETAWRILCCAAPLGLIAGRAWSARILANVAAPRVVQVAAPATAFASALLLLARSPSASWIAGFLVGAAWAPVLPTTLALAGEAWPQTPATGMGMVLAAGALGLAAGSGLIAWLSGLSRLPTAMRALPALALAMALVAMAMPWRSGSRAS